MIVSPTPAQRTRRRSATALGLVTLALLAGGCATLQGALDSARGGGASAPAASGSGATGGGEAAPAGDGGVYAQLTYSQVKDGDEADRVFNRFGVKTTQNPRRGGNPDATWIPGWEGLSLTDETKTAIAQAAVNRTWTDRATADFGVFFGKWSKLQAEYGPKIAQTVAGPGTVYTKSKALRELAASLDAAVQAAGLVPSRESPFVGVGPKFAIAKAAVELHKAAGLDFLTKQYLTSLGVDPGVFAKRGRPFGGLEAERSLFVAAARKGQIPGTPALPVMMAYGKGLDAVRWPTSEAQNTAATDAAAKLAEGSAALFGSLPDETPPSLLGKLGLQGKTVVHLTNQTTDADSASDHYTPATVKEVRGNTVVLTSSWVTFPILRCRAPFVKWTDSGERMTIDDCDRTRKVKPVTVEVSLEALPPGLTFQVGDQIEAYGDLAAHDQAGAVEVAKLRGRVLMAVKRGGADVYSYF